MAERTVPARGAGPGSPVDTTDRGPELLRRPDPNAITTAAEFATALTAVREQAGISIRDLAKLVGSTGSTLGGWFAGRHLPPLASVGTLEKVLTACGVAVGPPQTAWIDALTRVRRLPGPRPAGAAAPYRGLESYRPEDAPFFFGRERLVARLIALVTTSASAGPTVLVGPSGSGKSSALQAGLVARLRAGGSWRVVAFTPGTRPIETLDAAVAEIRALKLPLGSRVAVVVDQFEELFTLCRSEADRQSFVRRITAPLLQDEPGTGPSVTVLIALRADFYGSALRYEPLSHALQDRQVVVGPMSTQDLRLAVTEPARAAGVQLDPGLVELVLHDMAPGDTRTAATEPPAAAEGPEGRRTDARPTDGGPAPAGHEAGALPLMSFALLETWRRGRRSRLTVEDYVAAGGISGAVATAAEAVWADLTPGQREITRRLFLRLVAVGDDTFDTRRRATAAELGLDTPAGDAMSEVLERFVTARLLSTSETTVEIAHEALLTAWPRLRGWVDGDRSGLVTHRRLADAALTWYRDGRDPAVLHRGGALVSAREWAADPTHAAVLNPIERDFLLASVTAYDTERTAARRRARRVQALLAAVTVLAVLTAVLAAVALHQKSTAASDRDQALSRQLAEAANRLRAVDPSVAGQVALQAWHTSQTAEARSALLDTSATPIASRVDGPGGSAAVAVSGDGRTMLAAGDRGVVRVWSVDTGAATDPGGSAAVPAATERSTETADDKPLYAAALTRDGSLAAAGGASGVLHLWGVASGRAARLADLTIGRGSILGLTASPDGRTLAVATADGHIVLYDVHGTQLAMLGVPLAVPGGGSIQAVAFSADDRVLAGAGASGHVTLWTLSDRAHPQEVPVQLTGPGTTVTSVAFSPDGHHLLAGSKDQHLYLWQLATPTVAPVRFDDAGSWVNAVAFSPDGALVAAGSSDHHLRVYETSTRSQVEDLPHPGPITAANYLPDGRTLVTAAADGVVRLWPSPGPTAAMPVGRTFALGYLDGARLAAISSKDALRVFDVAQRYRPRPLGAAVSAAPAGAAGPGLAGTMAVAQRGSLLATGGTDGTVWLYEAATTSGTTQTRLVATLPHTQKQLIESAALSPDGKVLVTGSDDGTLQVTDVSDPAAPRSVGAPVRSDGIAYVLSFSPDGHRLAAGSGNPNRVTLWNLADPAHPAPISASPDGPTLQIYSLAFSPDGRTLATGSADRSVRLLDVSDAAHLHWLGAPMLGAGDYVYSVAFDRAGTTVAAASGDGAVRLWDVADPGSPVLRATLTAGGSDPLYAVAFDRTPGRLAAAGVGTTVRQWDTDPAVAAERICRVDGAPISDGEWGRYVPSVPYATPCSN